MSGALSGLASCKARLRVPAIVLGSIDSIRCEGGGLCNEEASGWQKALRIGRRRISACRTQGYSKSSSWQAWGRGRRLGVVSKMRMGNWAPSRCGFSGKTKLEE